MLESMYYLLFIIEMLFMFLICYFMFVEESSTKPQGLNEEPVREHIGNYRMAIPMIAINMVLLVLSAYGSYHIEWFLVNMTTPTTYDLVSTELFDYNIWTVIFFFLFFIHMLLFGKCVFDVLREGTYAKLERKNVH